MQGTDRERSVPFAGRSLLDNPLTQKFWPAPLGEEPGSSGGGRAPQGWSPTPPLYVNREEPGFKGRICCAGFVHLSYHAHRWGKVRLLRRVGWLG